MKLITRDTDYAIRVILYMIKKEESVSAAELTKELKIPRAFLRKILQVLSRRRILSSRKGKGGGFTLKVNSNKISLLDLIVIFQGRLKLNECTFKKTICPNIKVCKVKKKIDNIQKLVMLELKNIRLLPLIEERW